MYDCSIVSVIIPAYNVGLSLADAVASALHQTEKKIELIIVDDSSTDDTLEIARRFETRDKRVRVFANASNLGPAATRNRAIDAARGDWVALLDADDRWLPQRLQCLSAFFAGADVVADDVVIHVRGDRQSTLLASNGFRIEGSIRLRPADLVRYQLGLLQPIMRKAFLTHHGIRFDESLRIGEDFRLSVELLLAGARWTQVGDAYYVYRRRHGSLTSGRREHLEGRLASDWALLRRSDVRADTELTRLLEDRVRWLRDLTALLRLVELTRERRWPTVAKAFRSEPRLAPRVFVTAARHGYHVARRLLRRRRGAPAAGADS